MSAPRKMSSAWISVASVLVLCAVAQAQTALPPASDASVLIRDVRIFDGRSDKLSAPSNVLVVGNKISKISAEPIAADSTRKLTAGELMGIGFIADGRDEVLTATHENLQGGASQIKVMAGGGAASAYDPLDVPQYTLDEMKAAVEAADDWGTYVTVHAYTPKAVRRAIDAGVKCIEHGQLLDEPTMKLLGDRGIWLSLQTLEEAPATASEATKAKKKTVVDGADNAFKWARKYNVKLAWGTDLMFVPAQMTNQNTDILKLKTWMTSAQALKLVTHDNAQLLALSGPRNPYPGELGVVAQGALADLLLVDGDPIANLGLIADPGKNFVMIMKDGTLYKNSLH